MRLAAITYGTEGDTRPIADLGHALINAGHQVTLLADGGTLARARELDVPHVALAGDIRAVLQESGSGSVANSRLQTTTQTLARFATDHARQWMDQILAVAAGCDGLIVTGLATYVGFSSAEKLGIPAVGASLIPLTPTTTFPSPFLSPRRMPGWMNRLSYRVVTGALWREFRASTNAARRDVGLSAGNPMKLGHPMLYGISPTLLPPPADWPAAAVLCGQWARPTQDWQPPEAVQEFLDAGDPPIYIGFGSMSAASRAPLLDTIVAAVDGRRALYSPGWRNGEPLALPDNFCVIDNAPHDWLFRRTSLVMHHGGSGTSHSAARAGVPSVIIPFAADQFFWADQLRRRGIAATPGSVERIRSSALSSAITAAQSQQIRTNAARVGMAMRAEDGLGTAVTQISTWIASML